MTNYKKGYEEGYKAARDDLQKHYADWSKYLESILTMIVTHLEKETPHNGILTRIALMEDVVDKEETDD